MLGAMMKVELVAITHPVIRVHDIEDDPNSFRLLGNESFIAYCARVSNPSNQLNPDTGKLLSYMIKNQHWSPFEMVNVVMEIETTRDIARQILRHRSFSFQEFSQRYAEVTEMSKPREARLQDQKNRQNSTELDYHDVKNLDLAEDWYGYQKAIKDMSLSAYEWAIQNGIAKEQARVVLPEGLTMSRMYMNGTLRSWIHYCDLRCGNGTQKEHREVALECRKILIDRFPFLSTYWSESPK
jgi:thymidylate synthase (FAD)